MTNAAETLALVEELLASIDEPDREIESRLKGIALGRHPELAARARVLLAADRPGLQRAGVALISGLVAPGATPTRAAEAGDIATIAALEVLDDREKAEVLRRCGEAGSDLTAAAGWLESQSGDAIALEALAHHAAALSDFEALGRACESLAPAAFARVAQTLARDPATDEHIAFLRGLDDRLDTAAPLCRAHLSRGEPRKAARALLERQPWKPAHARRYAALIDGLGSPELIAAIESHASDHPQQVAALLGTLVQRPARAHVSTDAVRSLARDPSAPRALAALVHLCRFRGEPLGLPIERLLGAAESAEPDLQVSLLSALALAREPLPDRFGARILALTRTKKAKVREMAVWAACAHSAALSPSELEQLLERVRDRSAAVRAQLARGLADQTAIADAVRAGQAGPRSSDIEQWLDEATRSDDSEVAEIADRLRATRPTS